MESVRSLQQKNHFVNSIINKLQQISKVPHKSQMQGTSLFTGAVSSQRGWVVQRVIRRKTRSRCRGKNSWNRDASPVETLYVLPLVLLRTFPRMLNWNRSLWQVCPQ